ncbi:glycoside hydrolase family 3 protein [Aaosphaeria arxii CBS 175.79]|uniref:xylan 1,4-beta-xylosidase n=1 Tax=Aaosphaeria arxii CBS 175.79 TaxID=1450172 RepID=A0A6A5XP51_9PLEO|nr:glycoside hydrolase family 3 protein [Aaosphaeria arxii CBS 175.79]KAF2014679.1 glycoside hydrolase family 3 protein [Aaosphaeria arxii CBS 175.79]
MVLFSAITLVGIASLVPLAFGAVGPDCINGPLKSNKICDVDADPTERAAALVAAMRQQEKLANLNWWGEALHGVAGAPGIQFSGEFKTATSFPMPLLMSAAFDDDLIHKVATIIGTEARAFGNGGKAPFDFWTPNINPFKDPRWGRGSETPGEDTTRIKGYVKSLISGLEGDDIKERRIIATCKHFAANDLEDWKGTTRHNFNAEITQQDLAEYYLQPFQQCARDSKVGSFMCSYNSVNGVPACANTFLIGSVLRDHWKWDGNNYITSDCEAVLDVSQNHHYASSNTEGTALTFNAEMDSSCEYSGSSDIPGAWSSGMLNETTVDRVLNRLYYGLVRAGYFDGSAAVYGKLGAADVNTKAAHQLARQAASDGIVMLKNDNTLPLSLGPGAKVAMTGFWANGSSKLQGGYSGPAPFLHSPVHAAQHLGLSVKTSTGPILQRNTANDTWTTNALAAADGSEYILYFGGQDTSAAAEGLDRLSLTWPEAQVTLIHQLSALGKPLVVIQMGDMLDSTPLLAHKSVNSILWASWPGQDGGSAVMDIISGTKAVAGRLPLTQYPVNYTNLPMTDMGLRPNGSNPGRTYRWYPTPIRSFGYGLHYTSFNASFDSFTPSLSIQHLLKDCLDDFLDRCALPPLSIKVSNAANRTSDFVVLVFIKSTNGPKPYPVKTLTAYHRIRNITPGQTADALLEWTLGSVARHDEKGNTVLYPGNYQILLDEPVQATLNFTLTGTEVVLDKWPNAPA